MTKIEKMKESVLVLAELKRHSAAKKRLEDLLSLFWYSGFVIGVVVAGVVYLVANILL